MPRFTTDILILIIIPNVNFSKKAGKFDQDTGYKYRECIMRYDKSNTDSDGWNEQISEKDVYSEETMMVTRNW